MYIYGGMPIYACMGVCVGTHMDLYMYVCTYICVCIHIRVDRYACVCRSSHLIYLRILNTLVLGS